MLTVYGIETIYIAIVYSHTAGVATVLTVYGIETQKSSKVINPFWSCNSAYRLRY